MEKLLILDKDGTIVHPASGAKFVQSPTDQQLLPGVAETIDRYADSGWDIAIASNQGGVAAGFKSLESAIDEMNECLHLIRNATKTSFKVRGSVRGGILCPDDGQTAYWCKIGKNSNYPAVHLHEEYPEFIGSFRKPNPGMLLLLQKSWLNSPANPFTEVLMVGDRPEDEQASIVAGIAFMWADAWRGNQP